MTQSTVSIAIVTALIFILHLAVYQKIHYKPVYIAFHRLSFSYQVISSCCWGFRVCFLTRSLN